MARPFTLLVMLALVVASRDALAQAAKITPDVVYGHKVGLAMTLDVFTPTKEPNKGAVLFMVSGGWYSAWIPPEKMAASFLPLTSRGFTVFAVRHGSSPKFSIPEAVDDVRRAVRFVRHNADRFGIDPNRIGVYGASAGGHLSLTLGTTGDDGDEKSDDPVLRESSRVQAVVALVAPSDITRMVWTADPPDPQYKAFPALDLELEKAREVSPLFHVTKDDAPTLLIVGDKDTLVPMTHSEEIHEAFQKESVTSKLSVIEGADHGFRGPHLIRAGQEMCDWFEAHLLEKPAESEKEAEAAAAQ